MEREEIIKRAKELGYTKEMIDNIFTSIEEANKIGIEVPIELYLVELPINN